MTDLRSFDSPRRQAAEDRSIIDHLVWTFHADQKPAPRALRSDEISSNIRRQWSPESRAMLVMPYTS